MAIRIAALKTFDLIDKSDKQIILLQGGARSGKSYALSQLLIIKAISEKRKRIIIARKTAASCTKTTLHDFKGTLHDMGLSGAFKFNKSSNVFECYNTGTTIEFMGLDDEQRIRGLQANYFWFNEATEIEYDFFKQASLRMTSPTKDGKRNQFYLDYNPSNSKHWLKTELIDKRIGDYDLFISTYRDNIFLSDDAIYNIESFQTLDPEFWKVFGEGVWGEVKGQVYTNWTLTSAEPPVAENIYYGVDWGFSNDQTTLIEVRKINSETLYLRQMFYRKGLTNPQISERFSQLIPKDSLIVADSSEPKTIEEFKRMGWTNIQGVVKGNGSVNLGIDILKRYKLLVSNMSTELIEELNNYQWMETKDGVALNKPKDAFNHALDAVRYIAMTFLFTEPRKSFLRVR